MRRGLLVGAAAVAIAGIGGTIAWGTAGSPVDPLTVREVPVPPAPIADTADASVVWSGDEFLVWGGGSGDKVGGRVHAGGAAYDPTTGSWRIMALAPIEARERHAAVWTGSEMVVWGGTRRHHGVGDLLDGARYDPATDTWRAMAPAPSGTDRSGGQAVVTDGRVVIGAGYGPTTEEERTVLVHDLVADRWTTVGLTAPVVHLLAVGDRVALLTASHPMAEGAPAEVRVLLLDPATGVLDTVGHIDLDSYPSGAGLLAHGDDLWLLVEAADRGTTRYRVEPGAPTRGLVVEGRVDVPAPVLLFGGPEPLPVMHAGSRRLLPSRHRAVSGIDLASGQAAHSEALEGPASCLSNGSHGVGDGWLFVWAAPACTVEAGGPQGSALVEVTWELDAPS